MEMHGKIAQMDGAGRLQRTVDLGGKQTTLTDGYQLIKMASRVEQLAQSKQSLVRRSG